MVEKDGKLVRFRLFFDDRRLLSKSQRSQGLRRCWFRLKPGLATVGDLTSHLRKIFGLHRRIFLSVEDFVLPAFESIQIITAKDIIKVNKKKIKQNDVSKSHGPQDLLQDSQIPIPHNLAIGNEVLVERKPKKSSKGNESYYKWVLLSCRDNTDHVNSAGDFVFAKHNREHSNKLPIAKGQFKESNTSYRVEPNIVSGVAKQSSSSDEVCHKNRKRKREKKDKTLWEENDNDSYFKYNGLVSFMDLPPLARLPEKGDILAYCLVEQSSSIRPKRFLPQVGTVSSFDEKSLQITLIPMLDHVIVPEEENGPPLHRDDRPLEAVIQVDFCSLAFLRLLRANASTSQEEGGGWAEWDPSTSAGRISRPCPTGTS